MGATTLTLVFVGLNQFRKELQSVLSDRKKMRHFFVRIEPIKFIEERS